MARYGRGSDWLGDASDDSFLTHGALPRKSRDVKFNAIKTAADAREYARRFFHGAVDSAAKAKGPIRARWALAARQYVLAHDLAGQGGSLADVKAGLLAADTNSAGAIVAGKGKPLPAAASWTPPTQDSPVDTALLPVLPPGSSAPVATAPPAPKPSQAIPAAPGPAAAAAGGDEFVTEAREPAPATSPAEWLLASLLPKSTKNVKLEAVKSLADARQYARRFFAGAVSHGLKASGSLRQRWAEAARIYVYADRLAGDPFIERALDAVLNDLRAADILSAQALAAEKGGQLAPVTVKWFTSPTLAERGLATFELSGQLGVPSTSTSSGGSSSGSSSSGGTVPATSTTPELPGLPRRYDSLIDQYRGTIPRAFIRALIQAESGFDPDEINETSGARGLLQITPIVLKDWNEANPSQARTAAQLMTPQINLQLGIGTLRRIVDGYDRAHPSMRTNWRSARYVEVIAEAWNVGYSEAAGVGFILSSFERSGIPSTVEDIVQRGPQVPGISSRIAERITARGVKFPKRVRELYFAELARGGDLPTLQTAGISDDIAFVAISGLLLFGDAIFGGRSS